MPFRGANIRMSAVTTTVEWVFKLLLTKRCSKIPILTYLAKTIDFSISLVFKSVTESWII